MTSEPERAPQAGAASDYSKEIADAICMRLAAGESLRKICEDGGMPARSTVHVWLLQQPEFRKDYEFAREIQAEGYFEEIIEIADTTQIGEKVKITEDGTETTKADMVEHRKLRMDGRKWVLARMNAKKYGDRIQQEVTLNKVEVEGGLPDPTT